MTSMCGNCSAKVVSVMDGQRPQIRCEGWVSDHDRSLVQLAVVWTQAHPAVTATICGAKSPDQIIETGAAGEWVLSGIRPGGDRGADRRRQAVGRLEKILRQAHDRVTASWRDSSSNPRSNQEPCLGTRRRRRPSRSTPARWLWKIGHHEAEVSRPRR